MSSPALSDYVEAVSEYVRESPRLDSRASKTAQIALGAALGRVLKSQLEAEGIHSRAGEATVAGALRSVQADVTESHELDGLRLAVEIKPINLAVGRAIWNRFGDIRAFSVNIHLKFPFAVVGGVLAVPTWEWDKVTKRMLREAGAPEAAAESPALVDTDPGAGEHDSNDGGEPDEGAESEDDAEFEAAVEGRVGSTAIQAGDLYRKSTRHLIERLVERLRRTRRRETEADAPHLMEAITVIVYDPDTGKLDSELPPTGVGLRWDEFVSALADSYMLRFE